MESDEEVLFDEMQEEMKNLKKSFLDLSGILVGQVTIWKSVQEEWQEIAQSINECAIMLDKMSQNQENAAELSKAALLLPGMLDSIVCPLFDPSRDDGGPDGICRGGQTDLMRVVMHLNDHHRWSREQIADWMDKEAEAGNINIDFEDYLFANGEEK